MGTIKDVDKKLNDINFDISVGIKKVYLGLTTDKDDVFIPNQTLLEFGVDGQNISLQKQDYKCKVSVLGISITTLNTYEMLYMFANKLKKAALLYKEDLAI